MPKIDPPGFALESFDVIGGWREYYRTSGNGKAVNGGRSQDALSAGQERGPRRRNANGQRFIATSMSFKQLLLKDREQIARALCRRLLTYATGAATQAADQPEIDALVGNIRDRDYGLRTLVHEIVQRKLSRISRLATFAGYVKMPRTERGRGRMARAKNNGNGRPQ